MVGGQGPPFALSLLAPPQPIVGARPPDLGSACTPAGARPSASSAASAVAGRPFAWPGGRQAQAPSWRRVCTERPRDRFNRRVRVIGPTSESAEQATGRRRPCQQQTEPPGPTAAGRLSLAAPGSRPTRMAGGRPVSIPGQHSPGNLCSIGIGRPREQRHALQPASGDQGGVSWQPYPHLLPWGGQPCSLGWPAPALSGWRRPVSLAGGADGHCSQQLRQRARGGTNDPPVSEQTALTTCHRAGRAASSWPLAGSYLPPSPFHPYLPSSPRFHLYLP